MWKLTIEQKRYSEVIERDLVEKIVLFSEDLQELTMMIERITHCAVNCETSFKLERVGVENE